MATLQIPISAELEHRIIKAQKELKLDTKAACGRTLIEYVLENDITELRGRMTKAKLEKQHASIEKALQDLMAKKEETEKQLEKLSA